MMGRLMGVLVGLVVAFEFVVEGAAENYEALGAKLDVSVEIDQATIMVGEPTSFRYRVKNQGEADLMIDVGGDYRNALGRPDSFKIEVLREDGLKVPPRKSVFNFGGIGGYEKLPAFGEYEYVLFLFHWATFEEPGRYTIICRRELSIVPESKDPFAQKGVNVESTARGEITVLAADREKMGEVIDRLGKAMLPQTGDEAERACKMLSESIRKGSRRWFTLQLGI